MLRIINKFRIIALFFSFYFLAVFVAVCQEEPGDVATDESQEDISTAEQMDWLWGEVVLVSNQDNQITLRVLDEESLDEKEILMYVDKETTFDNMDSLLDIKPTDSLSIDYIVNAEGKNIARRITVEKTPEAGLSLPESVLNSTQPTYP